MPDTILGIHSNVRPGMVDPATGSPYDPSLSDGHAWLTVTRNGVTQTYGLWPDDHPATVDNGPGTDIRVGMESRDQAAASRYYKLTPEQAAVLEARLQENVEWGYTSNCSSWASETLRAVTGERVNANDIIPLVETPRVLGGSIHDLEQKDRTSPTAPTTPDAPNHSSSSLSDADGARTPAARQAALSPTAQQLLSDSERAVQQMAARHNRPWDQGMENTVAAVAQHARAAGLTEINQFNVRDGQIHYGQFDGVRLVNGSVDAQVAANAPQAMSHENLAQTDRLMQEQDALARSDPNQSMIQGATLRA